MKVSVCIPSNRDTRALFTFSLAEMVDWTARQRVQYNGALTTPQLRFHMVNNTRVEVARERLALMALEYGADYILWLDDDHTFEPDVMMRLAAHDLPIVGCNYAMRHEEAPFPTAAKGLGENARYVSKKAGLEAVDSLGLGVCLVKSQVFHLLPRPWFEVCAGGEDGYFCKLAREHGLQPHVDHSIRVGHIGEKIYTL